MICQIVLDYFDHRERCLRKSANNISGNCYWAGNSRWNSLPWGNDPIHKRQAENDVMGEWDKNTALFGWCKWTNEKVNPGALETLDADNIRIT